LRISKYKDYRKFEKFVKTNHIKVAVAEIIRRSIVNMPKL